MSSVVGTVERVTVYPVKSLGGRAVDDAQVEVEGLRGDRAYVVVDAATGERVSAKAAPRLHEVVATGDAAADAAALTAALGRPVRLAPSAVGPQVDAAAVHLVSRQAVDRAAAGEVPDGCSADDPRANLLLTLAADDGDERTWVGRRLRVGGALLRATRLPRHCLGVYAEVLEPGPVAVGDEVRLED